MPKIRPYSSQSCITQLDFPTAESVAALWGTFSSPHSFHSGAGSQRPGAVKGAPVFGAAKRTLDCEDRCETITGGRKAPSSNSAYPLQTQNSQNYNDFNRRNELIGSRYARSLCRLNRHLRKYQATVYESSDGDGYPHGQGGIILDAQGGCRKQNHIRRYPSTLPSLRMAMPSLVKTSLSGLSPKPKSCRRRLVSAALLITLGTTLIGTSQSAAAATLCVNPGGTGGCFSKITDAVTAAKPHDVIRSLRAPMRKTWSL